MCIFTKNLVGTSAHILLWMFNLTTQFRSFPVSLVLQQFGYKSYAIRCSQIRWSCSLVPYITRPPKDLLLASMRLIAKENIYTTTRLQSFIPQILSRTPQKFARPPCFVTYFRRIKCTELKLTSMVRRLCQTFVKFFQELKPETHLSKSLPSHFRMEGVLKTKLITL